MTQTTYPNWIFDPQHELPDPMGYGQRAVDAIRAMKHPKSRLPGQAFQLDPWQERIVRAIYGPVDERGNRIVRTVVIVVGRGNRKTALGAALSLLHTVGPERVNGGQVICAAADRKQARLAFEESRDILRTMNVKRDRVDIVDSRNRIKHRSGATLEAISSEAGTKHGATPTFVLADELHVWPKQDLWDVLRTGLVKTPNSLLVVITTAGKGQANLAHNIVDYARKVARGEINDPATLPILFENEADADWRDESNWHKANPGLVHGYPDITGLRQLAREAAVRPADQDAFKQLHLCMWLDGSAAPWLDMATFDEGRRDIDIQEREGERAWIGVDLGSTSDLTCVSLCLRDADGGFTVVPFVFAPDASVRKRTDRGDAPYALWREQAWLTTTPGDVTDYDAVEDCIRDLCQRFAVEEIALDPWGARPMMNRLTGDGLPCVEHRQGYVSFSGPMKAFEAAVLGRRLRWASPILRWCVANVAVEMDPAGNIKANKSRAKDKIDVAVASIMALGRANEYQHTTSIYKRPATSGLHFINW